MAAIGKAMAEGNSETLAKLVTGDDEPKKRPVDPDCADRGFRSLEAALSKRFGPTWRDEPAGAEIHDKMEHFRDDDLLTDWRKAKLGKAAKDEVAVLLDDAQPLDRQGSLVKTEGGWKLDAASLVAYSNPQNATVYRATADATAALAKAVADGKFATLDDAAKAVEEKLEGAEAAATPKPQTRPVQK